MRQAAPPDTTSLADSLRRCLVPALVLVDARGRATLTPEATEMLRQYSQLAPTTANPPFPPALLALTKEALRSETGTCCRTLDLSAGDGPPRSLHASAVRVSSGKRPGAVLVLNDLTGVRQIEQLLLHADRLANIGTISASMAHEVRNALVACRTFVDLLLEKHQDSAMADIVGREMKRIDDIVSRILRHSSSAAEMRAPLQVREVLEHALQLLQPRLTEKQITVERSYQANPDRLVGDENQLQQAFLNLLLNAQEALPPDGRLRVETECPAGGTAGPPGISVTIRDSGVGIPPENAARVFEPFFTTKPGGTGLGLAVTQRIVKEHGGTISVESQVGQGTSFRVFLPI